MKVQSAVLAMALGAAILSGACSPTPGASSSGTGGSSSGGTTGTGGTGTGTGTGGTGPSCEDVKACGGGVVGTWTASSSCLSVNGTVDPSWLGLDPRTCTSVAISGSLSVTGTFTANADGSYTDGTTTSGSPKLDLVAGCLMLSGTKVDCGGIQRTIAGSTCTSSSSGGCTCTLNVSQMGGIGVISQGPTTSDSYTLSDTSITLATDAGNEKYNYCVSGNQMTWTPQSANLPIHGTIVMHGGGSTGTGGSTPGSGGSSAGSGGSPAGSGGSSPGTGGSSPGTGGSRGTGGSSPGTGGSSAGGHGGTTPTGGATGTGTGGATGTGGSSTRGDGPCDIYATAGQPCAGAYSTIRALTKTYTGALYQVRSGSSSMNQGSGGMLKDIPQTADGFADTSVQDSFCSGTVCTFATLYDQSGNGNNLKNGSAGSTAGGSKGAMADYESSATKGMLMVAGHKVYSLYMNQYEGYRTPLNVKAKGVPMGNTAQGIYELADGTHSGTQCCWDFGSVSPDPNTYVTMNTLFFGTAFWGNGAGNGPWFMGDFEGGVWAGGAKIGDPGWGGLNDQHPSNPNSPSLKVQFALGVLHTPVGKYALRMADIKTATDLTTAYDGNIPAGKTWGNAGGIVLGVGGDNSNNSWGTFFEGALTNGSPSNATDLAVMQNVQAVGYGK